MGDLILVYKRVAGLASHTSRVSELLEQVRHCDSIFKMTVVKYRMMAGLHPTHNV